MEQLRLDTFRGKLEPLMASGGRKLRFEEDSHKELRSHNPFRQDIIRIKQSFALARLPGKMQVTSTPRNNHVSNRRSHTDLVVAIAMRIADILGLNIDLCIAAALGHDVGHCPYGPHGGDILGLSHPLTGVIILQEVEELNLTKEVLKAILYHSLDSDSLVNGKELSNEAYVVAIADKFAYLFKDILDFERTGLLNRLNLILPGELFLFGFKNKETFQKTAINICINALVEETMNERKVSFSISETAIAFQKIRKWLYENVYNKLNDMPERAYHKTNLALVLKYIRTEGLAGNQDSTFVVSMMDDMDVNWLAEILKKGNPSAEEKKQIKQLSVMEIVKSIPKGKIIDHKKYSLDW